MTSKTCFAEGPHQLAGEMRSDALDHARAQILLDAFEGARGHDAKTLSVLNCRPCCRSLTQTPSHSTYSPGVMLAALPITVTSRARRLTLTRNTQNPLSSLWKVTRSTDPEMESVRAVTGVKVACRSVALRDG